jgi:hypothetical protein
MDPSTKLIAGERLMATGKKQYTPPQLIVLGTVEDLTQQAKSKAYGGGDDVLVNNQAILANLS